ncbi:unnamed protein product [Brugia pahangi]|uniref:Uncharacterized protein n=1 Tax=Brugia pahangi TaxID=6280 RepID=A0A0N4TBL0_BRUPA|nr:unnamed protein product [Brugia pahangi]
MACGVALKRPYDYDDYLLAEGSEVKRARHTQTHCSPFRAQIGTIAASLPTSGAPSALMQLRDPKEMFSLLLSKIPLFGRVLVIKAIFFCSIKEVF